MGTQIFEFFSLRKFWFLAVLPRLECLRVNSLWDRPLCHKAELLGAAEELVSPPGEAENVQLLTSALRKWLTACVTFTSASVITRTKSFWSTDGSQCWLYIKITWESFCRNRDVSTRHPRDSDLTSLGWYGHWLYFWKSSPDDFKLQLGLGTTVLDQGSANIFC